MNQELIILYGGPSSERDVSFGTKDFFCNLYKELNPISVEWTKELTFIYNNQHLDESKFLHLIADHGATVIISSHGEYVEDGYIQSKFEKYRIPYTGSNSKSCKLSMDKRRAQKAVRSIVQTIPTFNDYRDLAFPFVAKPNSLGSSVGVFIVENQARLLELLPFFNIGYIFQPFVKGMELSLGTVRSREGFLNLYPTEIIPKTAFFDYEAKYTTGMVEEITPARISKKLTSEIQRITNTVHEVLGLGYYSRSDFILSDNNQLYYLETNALPGMTETSLVPQQLKHSGYMHEFKEGLLLNTC